MRAVRFGSYSMCATRAGISRLSRLKSMRRMCRRSPPPRCRTEPCPGPSRPPCPRRGTMSERSGRARVTSSKVGPAMPRRPGEVGLNFFTGMRLSLHPFEDRDGTLGQGDDRLLEFRAADAQAAVAQRAGALHGHDQHIDPGHLDILEPGLERFLGAC